MGLSKLVQQSAEAEQLDLRTFGRPPIDQVPTQKYPTKPAPYAKSSPSGAASYLPGRVRREKSGGEVAAQKGGPGNPHRSGT